MSRQPLDEAIPQHRHFTNSGEDYTCFTIHCASCGMPLYEFVHQQVYVGRTQYVDDYRIYAEPVYPKDAPTGYKSSQSWVKPAVMVECVRHETGANRFEFIHTFSPVQPSENRNQVIRSRSMTTAEFLEWSKEVPVEQPSQD